MRILLCLLALMVAACEKAEDSPTHRAMQVWVGEDFSSLEVQTLDGEPQKFSDLLLGEDMGGAAGKPVVMNVWATWCTPCIAELPSLDALGKSGRAHVIAIATDRDSATVKDFLRRQNWGSGMTVWFDPSGIVTRDAMGARAIPVTYVLDSSLTVVQVEAGDRDWTQLPLKTN